MKNIYNRIFNSSLKIITIFLLGFPVAANAQESMRANLYIIDANGATLVDGNLTNYNSIYSNTVDINDGWKMTNPGINFGIMREGYNLVVERRNIIGMSDTTFFKMWNLPQYNYQVKFMLTNLGHPGLRAIMKDNYLKTETPIGLNDTTYFNFKVDGNPASSDQMRFQLIYGPASPASSEVNFTGIKAYREQKNVMVEWSVTNEFFTSTYAIEHSADGTNFQELYQFAPINSPASKTYDYIDSAALCNDNFYRIKVTNMAGQVQYSPVAKVAASEVNPVVKVYPNPVENKIVQLQFSNLPAGKYNIALLYNNGSMQQLTAIQVSTGQSSYPVSLPQRLIPGIYRLQLTGPGKLSLRKVILVL